MILHTHGNQCTRASNSRSALGMTPERGHWTPNTINSCNLARTLLHVTHSEYSPTECPDPCPADQQVSV